MNFELSDELKIIQQTARQFAEKELLPYEEIMEEKEELPPEVEKQILTRAKDAGLNAINIPEEFGGGGYGSLGLAIYNEAVCSVVSGAMASFIPKPSNILLGCNEEQKKRFLIPAVNFERRGCFAITETEAGSDAGNIKTTAVKKGDKWILNGAKRFISHGNSADFAIVFAITDASTRSATCFLVEKGTPGFSVGQKHRKMGHRGHNQAELIFEDCEVPEENILGEVNKGWNFSREWLRAGRVNVGARVCGYARRAITLATEHAQQRVQFGKPIIEFQGVSFMLAECVAELYATRWMTYKVAWDFDQGLEHRVGSEKAAYVKWFAGEMAGRVVDKCLQVHGGIGYMKESPIERIYRDIRIERIWEGTSQVQLYILSKALKKKGAGAIYF